MAQNKEMVPFPGKFCRREGKSPQNANLRRWQRDSLRKGQPAGDERAHQAPHRPIKISNEGELSP